MREIDRALAEAYGKEAGYRDPSRSASSPRRCSTDSLPPAEAREPSPAPPPPHFLVPGAATVTLNWPATVRALEREHGARFERLADRLIEARDLEGVRVLLVTSCHRAEGRTTLVLTVARALARRPGRVLLVDGDLGGPMIARLLGLRPRSGLDDVVLDGVPAADAIMHAPDDHLSILPLRGPVARPREFLNSPGWSCLMARLRRDYEFVLIDGSPLFAGLSAAVLHRAVDAAVLVTHRALTGDRTLLRAREVLDAGGVPLLGLAETFV
ncbi:CpsD/CapB family tyrosine-protein kinase [Tautonia sociabilis]|uniref:Tyrosine-protein kinase family protein n=1 Tax=Tautonia sociabilis TaxID=2080755 RepID=A0A432MN16_9BACT|nr:CpsD/CapB family tyrosine-protein kinase [Tautonia sociabilis]RUL88812.1 tyrosine-protein kinase family protein [Tautonia sociabilis]